MSQINFYKGRLGADNEDWICSCNIDDIMGEPQVGDLVWLPFDEPEELERDMYIVKQRYISGNEINCFCKLYDWED